MCKATPQGRISITINLFQQRQGGLPRTDEVLRLVNTESVHAKLS